MPLYTVIISSCMYLHLHANIETTVHPSLMQITGLIQLTNVQCRDKKLIIVPFKCKSISLLLKSMSYKKYSVKVLRTRGPLTSY